jgi:hypothetical protein
MTQAGTPDTTTTASQAVAALITATAAYNEAAECTQDPYEPAMWDAYEVFLSTPARSVAEVLLRLKAKRWWDDELAGDAFADSIERDLCCHAGLPTAEQAAVLKQLSAPKQGSLSPAEVAAVLAAADERLDRAKKRELIVTNLFLAAPDPMPKGWLKEVLGGRAIAAVPTAELAQIVANLEATGAEALA